MDPFLPTEDAVAKLRACLEKFRDGRVRFEQETFFDLGVNAIAAPVDSGGEAVVVECGRKMGKTTAIAMFAAAVATSMPEAAVCCVSCGPRANAIMEDRVAYYVHLLAGTASTSSITQRIVCRYDDTPATFNVLLLDEAAPFWVKTACEIKIQYSFLYKYY